MENPSPLPVLFVFVCGARKRLFSGILRFLVRVSRKQSSSLRSGERARFVCASLSLSLFSLSALRERECVVDE